MVCKLDISYLFELAPNLELAPFLKAEKVNKRPPQPHPTSLPHPLKLNKRDPFPLPPRKKGIRTNKRLPRRRIFLQSVSQKPCFVTSSRRVLLLPFTVLLQNIQ